MAINLPIGLLKLLDVVDSPLINLSNGNDVFTSVGNINQHILALGGNDAVKAGGGSDIIEGGAGNDALKGEEGNDYIEGGAGNDAMDGGNEPHGTKGSDTLGYSQSTGGVTITLNKDGAGTGSGGDAQGDSYTGFENVVGSLFADTIKGNNSVNVLAGLAGNDKLYGMGGNDILIGGIGADVLDGGTGTDTADYSTSVNPVHLLLGGVSSGGDAQGDTFIAIEKFVGTAGADVFDGSASLTGFSADGGGGGDTMIGGHGDDVLSLGAAAAVASFAALAGEESGSADGGPGNDTVNGDDGNNVIVGRPNDGNDVVNAGAGDDLIGMGGGVDQYNGGPGNDGFNGNNNVETGSLVENVDADTMPDNGTQFNGGEGVDNWDISNRNDRVNIALGQSSASLAAIEGSPYQMDVTFEDGTTLSYFLDSIEDFTLTEADNSFFGNEYDNRVFGLGGNDFINGGGGNDTLVGGDGNDFLYAGFGVTGGNETLYGGLGEDQFAFASVEELSSASTFIQDFVRGDGDIIDLSLIDANTTREDSDAFVWVGSIENLTGAPGELAFLPGGGDLEGYSVIFGDVNGDDQEGGNFSFYVSNLFGDPTAEFFVL